MATEILFSPSVPVRTKSTMTKWLVEEMVPVKEGEGLCTVTLNGSTHEIQASCEGILLHKFLREGEVFEVPALIGAIGLEHDTLVDLKPMEGIGDKQGRIVKIKGVRKIISERMYESLQSTAQLTMHASADVRGLLTFRKACKASTDGQVQMISINDMLLWIISRVLDGFPGINALMLQENIIEHSQVNLGFAVDTPRGLIVPVIKDVRSKSLRQLSVEAKDLAQSCIHGKFSPEILEEGTFTVTNLGIFGISGFTPILNTPQVAILGIGGIEQKPVQIGSEIQFVPHIELSLTIDHRAIDGAPGARFLSALTRLIARFPFGFEGFTTSSK